MEASLEAEGAETLRLNYLITSRWIESYGVRVDPDTVLDTFPGLPDDVRAFLGQALTTDPRDFFSSGGISSVSSDGRTYTLSLSPEDAWRSGGQDRPGATPAKYKALHDVTTNESTGTSGVIGTARRPVVGIHANLFGVDAIPAPSVGGRVSAFTGSSVQQQSGSTNHTQLRTTEMTGVGETYNSDLTATWQVEGGPRPPATTPEVSGGTGQGTTENQGTTGSQGTTGNPPPAATTAEGNSGTGQRTTGNPPAATTGNPPPVTTATPAEGVDGIEMVSLRKPPPTTTGTREDGGTGPSTSGNARSATTAAEGNGGTEQRSPLPPAPDPARIPGGVELVLMGGLQTRTDLPKQITFSDLWAAPEAPPADTTGNNSGNRTDNTGTNNAGAGTSTGTSTTRDHGTSPATGTTGPVNKGTGSGTGTGSGNTAGNRTNGSGTDAAADGTGTNRNDRRYGGYLANSHPIAVDSITRRTTNNDSGTDTSNTSSTSDSANTRPPANNSNSSDTADNRPPANTRPPADNSNSSNTADSAPRPEKDTKPTSFNSWIVDRLGFDPPGTGANSRRVLHRTRGNPDTPAVTSQPKTGSRAQQREMDRQTLLDVFANDIVMTQLPTMTSEPRTLTVTDAKGDPRLITLWSQPVSMELVPATPRNFNIKHTDRFTHGSNQVTNRLKGFFTAFAAGIVSRLPGDVIRVESPSFEARFQKVWARGRGRSDNTWDSHLFHSTNTAVYNTQRTIAVWVDNDTRPTLFDVSATEALTADDVLRLSGGRPNTEPVRQTGDPFLDRDGGPTHLGDALVRDVTHDDGTEIRTPEDAPARPFFRDFAHQLLTEIDRQYPGIVLPHLAIPGAPEPKRSHAGWNHRRNKTQAKLNTEALLAKVNASSFRANRDAWLSGEVEIKLVETKILPWFNEFRERRLRVPNHISVWPRARFTGYSEATPLPQSNTGSTTGSSSGLSRQEGKVTSVTAEGRAGVVGRTTAQGLDSFGHPSRAGGLTGRATTEFRTRQRSEHGMSSASETNVKDKSGSRRLFADAEFSAWLGPKDALVPRPARFEPVSNTGMGREVFGNGDRATPPPRAKVELHTPRMGKRVPLDAPPAENPAPPRKLRPSEAPRLFRQGPDSFVTTGPQTRKVLRPTPQGLETIMETPEPPAPAPRGNNGNPPGPATNPPGSTGGGRQTTATTTAAPASTPATPPQRTTGNSAPTTTGNPPQVTAQTTTGNPPQTTTQTTTGNPPQTTTQTTTGNPPQTTTANRNEPPPLAIQRTPRAERLSQTFGTVQAFNSAISRRNGHTITVGSLTYAALDRNHWSFSRSVASRDGSAGIIADHTSSQTLAGSPGLMRSTGDRFRVQLDDGLAPQRNRTTTATWFVPTRVVSAALREFAVMEPNRVREISFSSGTTRENTFTLSVAARGAINSQPTAETPDQAPRGSAGPIFQPGAEGRYTPYGHGRGDSESVTFRTRREVKFTGSTFEFVTDGVILQATESKKDFDLLISVPRSTTDSNYTAWQAAVKDTQKLMVPALWVFSKGLVPDRLTWRDDGMIELGTQPPPQAPPAGLDTKPDLAGKGFDSALVQAIALVDQLDRQLRQDNWELTVHSREDVIKAVSEHTGSDLTGLEVLVKPTESGPAPGLGPQVKGRSRVATLTFDIRRGPANVEQLGGQMEYVDRNIKVTSESQVNSRIRGHGIGAGVDILAPIGTGEDSGSGRQTGVISSGGTPAFRQQSITEQSNLRSTDREETQERVLFSPYATVTTPTHVTANLSIGNRVYTAEADDNRQESVYPLPYLESADRGNTPPAGSQYRSLRLDLEGTATFGDTWAAVRRGENGTGYQDGQGGLDAIPLAIEGRAKSVLDAAVVNTALANGWKPAGGRPELSADSVASATKYLDNKISNIDRASGVTARKDELLLLALTPDATREPTVLGEFKNTVTKVRALVDTGAARIEGVSNDSRARDSEQVGGRQTQGRAEQRANNLGLGGQVTESGQPADRIRETGEAENVALSGTRDTRSAGQRHGAVASGPGTKRMFLVRVPTIWAVWTESAKGTSPVTGGQIDSSVLRWVDADQARAWGLNTDTPQIAQYAQAEAAFTKADAAYAKARGELFSFVGQADDPGNGGLDFQRRYQRLENDYHRLETTRNSAMRDLVDALRALQAAQPPAARATAAPASTAPATATPATAAPTTATPATATVTATVTATATATATEGNRPHGGETVSDTPRPGPRNSSADNSNGSQGSLSRGSGSRNSIRRTLSQLLTLSTGLPPFMSSPLPAVAEGDESTDTVIDQDVIDVRRPTPPPGSPRPEAALPAESRTVDPHEGADLYGSTPPRFPSPEPAPPTTRGPLEETAGTEADNGLRSSAPPPRETRVPGPEPFPDTESDTGSGTGRDAAENWIPEASYLRPLISEGSGPDSEPTEGPVTEHRSVRGDGETPTVTGEDPASAPSGSTSSAPAPAAGGPETGGEGSRQDELNALFADVLNHPPNV